MFPYLCHDIYRFELEKQAVNKKGSAINDKSK